METPNRTIHLYTNQSDLLYQVDRISPALIVIDDKSAGCSAELLGARIQATAAMPPATLVVVDQDRVAAVAMESSGGLFDYLLADCGQSMVRAKVSFMLRMQRQQQLYSTSLAELDRVNQHHQQLLDATADGILGIDENGVIRFANVAAGDLLRCDSEELLGRQYQTLSQAGWSTLAVQPARENSAGSVRFASTTSEREFFRKDGQSFPVACRPGAVSGDSAVTSVLLFEDISARKQAEAVLRRRAEQDPLTGLANRAAFRDFLGGALARARRSDKQIGLLYLDLDGFKQVNDELGHQIGDQLLTGIAKRLEKAVRGGDLVARVGGDEFVVVLDDVAGESGCRAAARTIARALNVPHRLSNTPIKCGSSIGIATFPLDGLDEEALIAASDQAMYVQKQSRYCQVA
ncbi:MAG: sensor domain-containing diguanylate cyclase [Immundisolibacteraceae bacterium]|nr:sensor domain-containing diguanylate cyclase [Immundisolibacteraceae bacterium]